MSLHEHMREPLRFSEVEKAVAIHCGGWDEIDGGHCTHAWRLLTGCKQQYTFANDGRGFACLGKFNPNSEARALYESLKLLRSGTRWRIPRTKAPKAFGQWLGRRWEVVVVWRSGAMTTRCSSGALARCLRSLGCVPSLFRLVS